jgi:hypothetical protein
MPIYAVTGLGLALCAFGLAMPALAQGADTPPGIVADQIRSQGFTCDTVEGASRDEADTTPGEQAWILTCSNATYRVKFVPDQAAHVEQID